MLLLLCTGKTVALSKTNWSPRSIALHDSLDLLGHFTCCYHVESSHHEKKKCQQFPIYLYVVIQMVQMSISHLHLLRSAYATMSQTHPDFGEKCLTTQFFKTVAV